MRPKLRIFRQSSDWADGTSNRRIFVAAATVGGFGLLASLAMVARELAIAREFGRSDQVDAYFIAYLLPLTLMQIVAGSLGPALVPEYIKVREREAPLEAKQLFAASMFWTSGLLLLVSAVFAATVSYWLPLMTSGFAEGKQTLTRELFLILLPSLYLSGVASLWTAALNAGNRFALGALSPAAVPLAAIAALLFFGKTYGIHALAVGTLAGHLLQCLLLIPELRGSDIPVLPRWQLPKESIVRVARQYAPAAAGALVMSTTTLVDQGMAAMLGPGSVAALSYGNKVVNFVLGVGAAALSTAVLPEFSRLNANANWSSIRRTTKVYSGIILGTGGLAALVLFVLSDPLVTVLFQRGAFSEQDTATVARVQAMYVLQIPFYVIGIMLVRLLSALQLNAIIFWGALINVTVNIVLNLLFMRWLGVAGIALSTSVVYFVAMIFFGYVVHKELNRRTSSEANPDALSLQQRS